MLRETDRYGRFHKQNFLYLTIKQCRSLRVDPGEQNAALPFRLVPVSKHWKPDWFQCPNIGNLHRMGAGGLSPPPPRQPPGMNKSWRKFASTRKNLFTCTNSVLTQTLKSFFVNMVDKSPVRLIKCLFCSRALDGVFLQFVKKSLGRRGGHGSCLDIIASLLICSLRFLHLLQNSLGRRHRSSSSPDRGAYMVPRITRG